MADVHNPNLIADDVYGAQFTTPAGIYATDVTMPPEVMSVTYTVSKHGYWALTAKVAQ